MTMTAILLALFFLSAVQGQICPKNMDYRACGTACEPSCSEVRPRCNEFCVTGCQCATGYVRNDFGFCVHPGQCGKPLCPPNEQYLECGSACEPTCATPRPLLCSLKCVRGCQCELGYLRSPTGSCVKPTACKWASTGSSGCKKNEIKVECGSLCNPTCDVPNAIQECASKSCIPDKCECIPGHVRKAGRCIPTNKCTTGNKGVLGFGIVIKEDENGCPLSEEFRRCEICEGTCDNPNPSCPGLCAAEEECYCKKGYVRKYKDSACVPLPFCRNNQKKKEPPATTTKTSGNTQVKFSNRKVQNRCLRPNEQLVECSGCEGSCQIPTPVFCPKCGPPKCQCIKGHVRSSRNLCIPKDACATAFANIRTG